MTVLVQPVSALAIACTTALGQIPPGAVGIDRETYLDQLEGFWLAECIANWTGLQTEGRRQVPPFYTDADWPTTFDGRMLRFVTDQDPWKADDDTDIEYVYQSLMNEHATPCSVRRRSRRDGPSMSTISSGSATRVHAN